MTNTNTRRGFTHGCFLKGFTLIELLVVVIIIAVLSAVAMPMYKHAVLKSRFSTVMPMAKSIANAQEVYYQGRQMYALDVDELDVTPVNAENTSVSLSQTDGYDYVMAQNSQVPGANYIIYQKYSENYPSEIHCEAADDNADAQWLCGVLSNNNSIGKTVTDGYTTYIINGTGAGIAAGAGNDSTNESGQVVVSCNAAQSQGYTCSLTTNAQGKQEKTICTETVGEQYVCRTKVYEADGSYSSFTCGKSTSEDTCYSPYMSKYDKDGRKLFEGWCDQEECETVSYALGISYDGDRGYEYQCTYNAQDGICEKTDDGWTEYTYENGKLVLERGCNDWSGDTCVNYANYGSSYIYDGDRLNRVIYCSFNANGICEYGGQHTQYSYDDNGKMTAIYCLDENCESYEDYYVLGLDDDGKPLYLKFNMGINPTGNEGFDIAAMLP